MKCLICNNENPDNAVFCVKCGKQLWVNCSCGKKRQYGLKFCPHCGKKTEEQTKKERESNGCLLRIVSYIVIIMISPILALLGIDYRAVAVSIENYFNAKEEEESKK